VARSGYAIAGLRWPTGILAVHGTRGRRGAVLVTVAGCGAAAVAIAALPQLHSAYRWPTLHAALQAAASLTALLAAFLVFGRFRRRTLLDELVLACGLVVLALSGLCFETLPALTAPVPHDPAIWASLAGGSLGALLFALAAFVPRYRLRRPGLLRVVGASAATTVLLIALITRVLASHLPSAPASWPVLPGLRAYSVLAAMQLALAVLYGLAAAGFLRRARQLGDEFLGWLAMAAVVAAFSRVIFFLYPVLDVDSAFVGEALRACFYALLLVGSMREIFSYWRALSDAAVQDERRRIACDLHDGLAQELAYLARNLDALADGADKAALGRLRQCVERAQLESRRAIHALSAPTGQALGEALADAVAETAERFRVQVEIGPIPEVEISAARAEALVRIACEAVSNAARHSGAGRVRLSLEHDGPRVRLRVSDAGRGFDATAGSAGFGLISMRERARSVGGELRVSSVPGRGSQVEAAL
jgi:signal transduction histidine kinase